MRFAGIDVASKTHVVAIVDEAGQVLLRPAPFSEDAAGYARLFALLKDPTDILVAVEATGHYGRNLLGALSSRGFPAALINPVRTRRFAEEDLARAKNDSIDAVRIARFAAQKRPAPTPPPDEATNDLRQLVWFHDRLVQDFGDRLRQLHRLVALCFPEFTRHVRGLDSQRATRILHEYPTAAAFDQTSLAQLSQLRYGERHLVGPRLARILVDAAKTSVAWHHGRAYRDAVQYVCSDLDRLRDKLQDLSADLEAIVHHHPIASLLTTIPGLGSASAARIIAAMGDPARFRHGAALAGYAGVVPQTNQSGLYRPSRGSLSPMGSARLRRALYMPTLAAVRLNPWLRAFYQRLRARGKLPKVALLAAERKLLMAVYSVAKNRRPFVARTTDPSQQ
jgi:transposase